MATVYNNKTNNNNLTITVKQPIVLVLVPIIVVDPSGAARVAARHGPVPAARHVPVQRAPRAPRAAAEVLAPHLAVGADLRVPAEELGRDLVRAAAVRAPRQHGVQGHGARRLDLHHGSAVGPRGRAARGDQRLPGQQGPRLHRLAFEPHELRPAVQRQRAARAQAPGPLRVPKRGGGGSC